MMRRIVETTIRTDIQSQSAYQVPDASGFLKLDAMESPHELPPQLQQQWLDKLAQCGLNRYPDASTKAISEELKNQLGLGDGKSILWGNGSDEIIQILIQAVAGDDVTVFSPSPSFVMYQAVSSWNRVNFVSVDLNDDFSLNLNKTLEVIKTHQPKLIFLAQPNNPTGNLWAEEDLIAVIQAASGLVVIDEAYVAYSARDHLSWIDRYDNVVVLRTFSKEGFAGIRLGYLVGRTAWVEQLNKLRMPYNINVMTQATAEFVLAHWAEFRQAASDIVAQRESLTTALRQRGHEVLPSQANFLVVRTSMKGKDLHQGLMTEGVLVKNLCQSHPLFERCIRVTVSTAQENNVFLSALDKVFLA